MRGKKAVLAAMLAVAVVVAGVWLVARPELKDYKAPTAAMAPTITRGATFVVNLDAYGGDAPQIGDIVLFHPPVTATGKASGHGIDGLCAVDSESATPCPRAVGRKSGDLFVRRVVARGGDLVAVRDGHAIRNEQEQAERFTSGCTRLSLTACNFRSPIRVSEDHFFVLGDNRVLTDDSRLWGPIPREWIVGRVDDCRLRFWCSPSG